MDLFKGMSDLKQKLLDADGKDLPLEELKIIEYQPSLSAGDDRRKLEIGKTIYLYLLKEIIYASLAVQTTDCIS